MRALMMLYVAIGVACGGSAPPPQAAAPPPPAPKKIVRPVEPVQPEKVKVEEPYDEDVDGEEYGDPDGVEGGVEGGQEGGVVGGVIGAPPPPPRPPTSPHIVPQGALQAQMIAGEKQILPDELTKATIARERKERVVTTLKLCVNAAGRPSAVKLIKSSGYPGYDAKLVGTMYGWRFRPYLIGGVAREVCTAFTFIYSQKSSVLEVSLQRISGDEEIQPDAATRKRIDAARKRIEVVTQICVDEKGVPSSVTLLVPSGHPALDRKIQATMRTWRFKPHLVDGKAVVACDRYFSSYGHGDLPALGTDEGEEAGDEWNEDDEEDGQYGGVVGGVVGPIPPPPPPPSPSPQIVPQVALQRNMIAGEKAIMPDEATKKQIVRDGKSRLVFTLKICVSAKGLPSSVTFMKTSGYPAYDRKVTAKVKAWRFTPFIINGKPVDVCSAYTIIYNQAS